MGASVRPTFDTVQTTVTNLQSAMAELLDQEFAWSPGHLAALVNGCVFAPSLLTFWLVNGLVDFSTAFAIGSIASPGGLVVRLIAYVLLVPVFVALRASYYLLHPVHRRTVLSGACPQSRLWSLDWFSVGILATGLPLALQDTGPWVGSNAVFVFGLFVLPRFVGTERRAHAAKYAAIAVGSLLFLYANYGGAVAVLPHPATVLGPVATAQLSAATTETLLRTVNSLLVGPVAIAAVAFGMSRVLTRPELTDLPLVHHGLPQRDPPRVVVINAALGTVFYLLVVAAVTGRVVVVP